MGKYSKRLKNLERQIKKEEKIDRVIERGLKSYPERARMSNRIGDRFNGLSEREFKNVIKNKVKKRNLVERKINEILNKRLSYRKGKALQKSTVVLKSKIKPEPYKSVHFK